MSYTEVVEKYKYLALLTVLSLLVVLISLIGISYVSLVQTVFAFETWVDPSIPYVGGSIPWLLGILFQYGQTAALYIRKVYGNNRPLQNGFPDWVTSNNIALGFFFAAAIVDASTNIVWYNNVVIPRVEGNLLLYRIIGYIGMIIIVFVEEGTGIVIQGLVSSWKEYKSICESEKRILSRTSGNQSKNLQPYGGNRPGNPYSSPSSSNTPSRSTEPVSSFNRPSPKPLYQTSMTESKPEPSYHPIMPKPAPYRKPEVASPFDDGDDDDDSDIAEYLARKNR